MNNFNAPSAHQGDQDDPKGGRGIVILILLLTVIVMVVTNILVGNNILGFLQSIIVIDLAIAGVSAAILTAFFEQKEIRKSLRFTGAGNWAKIRARFDAIIRGIMNAWRWVSVLSKGETHLAAIYGDFLQINNPQDPQTFANDCSS